MEVTYHCCLLEVHENRSGGHGTQCRYLLEDLCVCRCCLPLHQDVHARDVLVVYQCMDRKHLLVHPWCRRECAVHKPMVCSRQQAQGIVGCWKIMNRNTISIFPISISFLKHPNPSYNHRFPYKRSLLVFVVPGLIRFYAFFRSV